MTAGGKGFVDRLLSTEEILNACGDAVERMEVDGKRVLVIIPDATRTCPVGLFFRALYDLMAPRVNQLDFLVALGTHAPMSEDALLRLVGITVDERKSRFAKAGLRNHLWRDPGELVKAGTLSEKDTSEITGGLFGMEVAVTCNKMLLDHDIALIVGPVFPHEVVGFSGGNKYLFPGVAGREIIDFFHWLGAVITSPEIIGCKYTPVRRVVDRAAAMLPIRRHALCMVIRPDHHASSDGDHGVAGLYYGTPEEAWSGAADLSEKLHIVFKPRPFHTIVACAPEMYDDLWTGGKCMYKTEPVAAAGGKVVIFAPHIREISQVHGSVIEEIGYHTRDFFLKQWDRYNRYPWGVLAHSTHVKGAGTWSNGVENPRVEVVLATGMGPELCRKINLGYIDWRAIKMEEYAGRENEGILLVPRAGEILYRIRKGTV